VAELSGVARMSRHILFCSDFPLGYHNREAERKLAAFVDRGYGATYVEKLGVRNPSFHHARVIVQRLRAPAERVRSEEPPPFAALSPRVLPPRRAPVVDGFNRRWLARQLLSAVPDPAETVLWLRFPTPELVPLAERPDWAGVVYEVVDDHEQSPGATPHLVRIMRAAEARILRRAGVVFAAAEPVAERLAAQGADVVMAPAAADLDAFAAARGAADVVPRTAVYAGSLDFRFDASLVAAAARALPDWRFRLAGPAEAGVTGPLEGLGNVELLGPLPPEAVPALLASATVSLLPYRMTAFNDTLFPIKLIESLASGRPAVSTAIRPVRAFADVVTVAGDAEAFVAGIRASADDDSAAVARRLERAADYGWDRRIDGMQAAIEAVLR
jgi:glycosyltransferase involved in cell wall biosynthesis